MINQFVVWTKSYKLTHQKGSFKIYVSSHTDRTFWGAILHFTKTGNWSAGDAVHLKLQMERFVDLTENGVYQQCEQWVKQNLPGKYSIKLEDTKGL